MNIYIEQDTKQKENKSGNNSGTEPLAIQFKRVSYSCIYSCFSIWI